MDRELYNKISKTITDIFNKIRRMFENIYESILDFLGRLYNKPGYKRIVKVAELSYYKSISNGKSNNWRRQHGLALIRKKQNR